MASRLLHLRPLLVSSLRPQSTAPALSPSQSKSSSDVRLTALDANGVKVVSDARPQSQVAHVTVAVDTGVKYESAANNGVSNFLEHMLLKGTAKRPKSVLEREVKGLGARLSARAGRDQLLISASCTNESVPQIVDILADITQNSVFNEEVMEEERSKILRQLNETESDPQLVVMDLLHSTAFQGTPLARSVLGSTKNVESMSKEDLALFWDNSLKGPRVSVSGAGGVDHSQFLDLATKHFGNVSINYDREVPIDLPYRYTGSDVRFRDDSLPFCYVALAVEGVGWNDERNLAMMLATTLMGNWDKSMGGRQNNSSRLAAYSHNLDLAKGYQTFNINYQDTGLWGVYFVAERLKLELMAHNVMEEWKRFCTALSEVEVQRAKNELKATIRAKLSQNANASEVNAVKALTTGEAFSIEDFERQLDALSSEEVISTCWDLIYDRCLVVSAFGPCENLPEYIRLRSNMYWLRL